ncbi:MAG TPA: RHS repeat-associated core domain-containing protein [Ignavibacteria bacterium]|nr:RHS repeat-associated core domain-containing protein [Ignavibacteria bacterium]
MKYDDMGMRIRKTEYLYTGNEQEPVFNEDAPIGWTAITDLYYIRDATGKEIAIYNSYDIKQWNLFGFENEGYLNPDGEERIYIKDHLGSIRVTLDDKLAIINAQDYDAWGYMLEDKQYNLENATFKFTGKEREKESGYDYFGARYYNSRIGRWGQVEPLLDKYVSFSPFCYGLNSPLLFKDVDGRDARVRIQGENIYIDVKLYYTKNGNFKWHLTSDAETDLKRWVKESQELWNEAGGKVSYEGKEYNVIFNIQEWEIFGFDIAVEVMNNLPEGENVALYDKDKKNPGVAKGNQLWLINLKDKKLPRYAGPHEIGHLLGLKHPFPKDSKEQKESKDVMGYHTEHNPPAQSNVIQVMRMLSFSKQNQTLKGATYDH